MRQPVDREAIERVVIDTLAAASSNTTAQPTRETEVLQLVGSLGLIVAVANIQAALSISLQRREMMQVFQCRYIADLALVLEGALSARLTSQE
jgi:hypothetical protein